MPKLLLPFLLLFVFISYSVANAQTNFWNFSSKITWEYKYSRAHGAKVAFPVFPSELKELQGKEVYVKGYAIPTQTSESIVLLSHTKNRYCLHCAGGTSNIIGVSYPKEVEPNTPILFRGKLYLNDTKDGLIYYLKEAELINNTDRIFQTVSND